MSDAYTETTPYPLDVLGSETEGQIGYVLELELGNAIPEQETVAVLTRVVVDADDPAFSAPSKFIGPVYSETRGTLARRNGTAGRSSATARTGVAWCLAQAAANCSAPRARASRRRRLSRGLHRRWRDPGHRGSPRLSPRRGGRHRQRPRIGAAGDRACAPTRSCWRLTSTPSTTTTALRHSGRSRKRRRRASDRGCSRPGRWARRSRQCAASSSTPAAAASSAASYADRRAVERSGRDPGAAGRPRSQIRRKEDMR